MVRTNPGSLSEGAAERSEAEGVYFDEWYKPKYFELRRGDENRPPTPRFRKYPVEWQNTPPHKTRKNHPPADETSSGRVIGIVRECTSMNVNAQKFQSQ